MQNAPFFSSDAALRHLMDLDIGECTILSKQMTLADIIGYFLAVRIKLYIFDAKVCICKAESARRTAPVQEEIRVIVSLSDDRHQNRDQRDRLAQQSAP